MVFWLPADVDSIDVLKGKYGSEFGTAK